MRRAVRRFEKEVSCKLGREVGYVTSNFMRRAVRQFEKEVSFKLETEVDVTSTCMGPVVRQFEKEVSFKLGTGEGYVTSNCMHGTRRPLVQQRKKLISREYHKTIG